MPTDKEQLRERLTEEQFAFLEKEVERLISKIVPHNEARARKAWNRFERSVNKLGQRLQP